MLRTPRRLPQRFNRPVSSRTRSLVERRHQRQKQYRTERFKRLVHKLQRRAASLRAVAVRFALFIVIGLVLLGIGLAVFSPILNVREIRVSRSDPRIDVERIQRALSDLFGERLPVVSAQHVEELLQAAVPDLAEAEISKQYPSTLQVRITLDPIIAKLRIGEPDQDPGAGSGALAGSGVVLPSGSDFLTTEGMYVVYRDSQVQAGSGTLELDVVDWAVRPAPWKQLVSPTLLQAMGQAEEEMRTEFGHSISRRAVYIRAREFHLQTESYALWFDLRSPLEEQVLRYRFFLEFADRGAVREYIDLRLKDKVVYR
jgi:hypothetical protein